MLYVIGAALGLISVLWGVPWPAALLICAVVAGGIWAAQRA